MICLLCSHETSPSALETFDCINCGLKFKNPKLYLSDSEEASRYRHHNNDPEDDGYKKFLGKCFNPLTAFLKPYFSLLDFGCGPGPTLTLLAAPLVQTTANYDPLFFPEASKLEIQYDVVTSTEVVEHFKHPKKDWELLVSLVRTDGYLAIMTQFLKPETNFEQWWYKNDPTHLCFYRPETFTFLATKYQLEEVFCDDVSVIIFKKRGR